MDILWSHCCAWQTKAFPIKHQHGTSLKCRGAADKRDAQNYGWRFLWKADGLQPQQRPGSQTHQLINDCLSRQTETHIPEEDRVCFEKRAQGRRRRRRRGLALRSHHMGITFGTNKRLEEMNGSHVLTSLTPDATMENICRQQLLLGRFFTHINMVGQYNKNWKWIVSFKCLYQTVITTLQMEYKYALFILLGRFDKKNSHSW